VLENGIDDVVAITVVVLGTHDEQDVDALEGTDVTVGCTMVGCVWVCRVIIGCVMVDCILTDSVM